MDREQILALADEFVSLANALIEAYKAELLKEVGEPVAVATGDVTNTGYIHVRFNCRKSLERGELFFTSDQVAAAVLKAEQRVAEACADYVNSEVVSDDITCLDSQAVALLSAAGGLRSGGWRQFMKEGE